MEKSRVGKETWMLASLLISAYKVPLRKESDLSADRGKPRKNKKKKKWRAVREMEVGRMEGRNKKRSVITGDFFLFFFFISSR